MAKPTQYVDWTQGAPTQVTQPTPTLQASGFSANQRPSYQTLNWLFYQTGQWVRALDEATNATAMTAALDPSIRLTTAGVLQWAAATGVLSWTAPMYLLVPGLAEAANTIAAGQVTLAPGQVAYVTANIPFTTTGNTTSGSAQITGLAYGLGIAVGQNVAGVGIPPSTTVTQVQGQTVTLSQAATASATGVTLSFASSNTLTVNAVAASTFAPTPNMVVIAHCATATPTFAYVGVNSSQMMLRDGEARFLGAIGYGAVITPSAGVTMAARTAVYISQGSGDSWPLTANTTSGSATIAAVTPMTGLMPAQAIAGPGIPAGTTVASVGSGQVTLSNPATATATGVTLTVTRNVRLAYPADASAALGSQRGNSIGFVVSAVPGPTGTPLAYSPATVVASGLLSGFSNLLVGATYYLDPATPGAITPNKPTTVGQWAVPVGQAVSTQVLLLNPAAGEMAAPVTSINPWPQYGASSEGQLAAALSQCQAAGGGVIVLTGAFTLSNAYTVSTGTILQGRKGASTVTLGASSGLTLADGGELRDVAFAAGASAPSQMVSLPNNYAIMRGCSFVVQPSSSTTCVFVTGTANRLYQTTFSGVANGTATGIYYAPQSNDNSDASSVFLS